MIRRRRGMAWRPKQYKAKVVRRLFPPGLRNTYFPMEIHPDWDLFTGSGPTTVGFNDIAGVVWTTETIPGGTFWPLIYSGYGQIDDVDMSFVAAYSSGNSADYETYLAVKGIDADNFVGVTIYNGAVRIYEHTDGTNWTMLVEGGSDADIVGKTIRFTVTGSQVELFVDGVSKGTATTQIDGVAYMGMMVRGLPKITHMLYDMNFQGRRVGQEVQIVPCRPSTNSWTIDESSRYSSDYDGLEAFNCSTANGNDAWVSGENSSPPQWLQAIQTADIHWQPTRLVMKGRVGIADDHMNVRRPDPLVLQGSNNGTDWVEIQRWTNTGPWGAGETKTFIVTNRADFRHFRIVWENFGEPDSTVGAQIGWVKIYGYDVDYSHGEPVTYQGQFVTHNGEVVTYG